MQYDGVIIIIIMVIALLIVAAKCKVADYIVLYNIKNEFNGSAMNI